MRFPVPIIRRIIIGVLALAVLPADALADGAVVLRGRTVASVRTRYGKADARQRADNAERALRPLLESGGGARVQARKDDTGWGVWSGSTLVLRATRAEAKAQGSSPAGLAARWAAGINRVLAMPPVALSTRALVVPLGEKRTLVVGGYVGDGLQAGSTGEQVCRAEMRGRHLVVSAVAEGRAEVIVTAPEHGIGEERAARCVVIVKRYAGRLDAPVVAEVTGRPASASFVADAAAYALRRDVVREPGTQVTILERPRTKRSIRPGESMTVTARVRIAGGDFLPLEGQARVAVRNVALPQRDASLLLYSNNPERITAPGTLFSGIMDGDAPVRLFYHHVNNVREPVALSVTLTNPGDDPVAVHLAPGFAPPDADPIRAGHNAGRAFFRSYRQQIGEITTVPPMSTLTLALDRLRPEATGSGIAELRLVNPGGARCLLRVTADRWAQTGYPKTLANVTDTWRHAPIRSATLSEKALPGDMLHVYSTPVKQVDAHYIAGGTWAFVRIGQEPVRAANGTNRLDGNYGVVYRIGVTLENPSAEQKRVEVAFEAGAGPANGVFLVGDRMVDLNGAYEGSDRNVAHFNLAPNETKRFTIETMPLGGGFYPAALVIR